ncbi:glycosyltransferase family 4 protein [Clostridium botulinum]|uniref:Glycosyltransferase family 4 protein n=1 Tax=Clostridium botulinum TaxID=1491 RepID=A0A6G4HT78_CLOBO|nr:glycosyltransferase [Clostridium botulinum]MBD5588046.1 glycosyl transferase [Clostridium botulinum]MBO0571333.1 glycosyl transferase [Clostridium botulinum]MBO0583161.1 glycosyl transferase [Clostridium botulinum]NFJ62307.1 glycosyltransferase family 4 protein [Clostridium botulinum]NFJ67792.1 glycosyltransferase family 4 protein [Clostridium botulinum]
MVKEKVVIFGASKLGEIAYGLLKDKYDIRFFCDNDNNKWNNKFCGINIISPEELLKLKNYKIIITSMYSMEIAYQLFDIGLKNIKVFHCNNMENINKVNFYVLNDVFGKDEFNYIDNGFVLNKIFEEDIIRDKDNKSRKKNVLMICYSFPPIGRSGVQRSLKFAKYLYELGWNPIVVTTGKMSLSYDKDYSLLKEISKDIKIIRIEHDKFSPEELHTSEINEIVQLQRGLLNEELYFEYVKKLKDNSNSERKLLINPDEVIIWASKVLREICDLVNMENVDLVYTTSSPYSDHIVGYYLKKHLGIPWVADFRDEWTNDIELNLDKDSLNYKLQRSMEENIVQLANKILTVTPLHTANYINTFNLPSNKVCTITNGYDEVDFINIKMDNKIKNNKFTIIYNGTLYYKRNPSSIIETINNLIDKNLIDMNKIEIKFIGYCEELIKKSIEDRDKYNICKFTEYIEHKESLNIASRADLLLLLIGDNIRYRAVYTGKVFEYLRINKPIIAISPKESVVENLLKETNSGVNIEFNNMDGISKHILSFYNAWLDNKILFKPKIKFIKQYERKNLTKKLIGVFNSILYKI